MYFDALMWSTQDKYIIQKIQQKYDINSLIEVLHMNDESFILLGAVVLLLKSCYLNPNHQLQTVDEFQILEIKECIYNQLEKTIDVNNFNIIRFAMESITLFSNCFDNITKESRLKSIVEFLLNELLKDFDVYTKPNAIDFELGDAQTFLGYGFINNHNEFINNEWYERDAMLEAEQRELIASILKIIIKFGFNEISYKKTELDSWLLACLNINEQMIEKWIVLLILKYVDIPFDEDFTDSLFDTLLHLQSKTRDSLLIEIEDRPTDQMLVELWSRNNNQNKETDIEFIDFSRIVQNAIVSIHNCEVIKNTQNLDEIKQLIQKITEMQEHKDNSGDQSIDSRFAIILAELLYKIRCNSTFIDVRRNRLINELVVKVYKFLGHFMHNNQQIWVRLWYFSHKLFCMKWWNDKLNRYHVEFFLLCVEGLGKYKTTLYTKELFSKVIKSIGEILVKELQKEVSRNKDDESLNKLLTLITQIGEKLENNTIKKDGEGSKEERNEDNDNQGKEESKENEEEKEKEIEYEDENENEEEENEEENKEIKISFIFPKSEHIF